MVARLHALSVTQMMALRPLCRRFSDVMGDSRVWTSFGGLEHAYNRFRRLELGWSAPGAFSVTRFYESIRSDRLTSLKCLCARDLLEGKRSDVNKSVRTLLASNGRFALFVYAKEHGIRRLVLEKSEKIFAMWVIGDYELCNERICDSGERVAWISKKRGHGWCAKAVLSCASVMKPAPWTVARVESGANHRLVGISRDTFIVDEGNGFVLLNDRGQTLHRVPHDRHFEWSPKHVTGSIVCMPRSKGPPVLFDLNQGKDVASLAIPDIRARDTENIVVVRLGGELIYLVQLVYGLNRIFVWSGDGQRLLHDIHVDEARYFRHGDVISLRDGSGLVACEDNSRDGQGAFFVLHF